MRLGLRNEMCMVSETSAKRDEIRAIAKVLKAERPWVRGFAPAAGR